MNVRQLIDLLGRFDPEAEVRLGVSSPARVVETHTRIWVGDYGGGPQINSALDLRGSCVFVGFGLGQLVKDVPEGKINLGHYESEEVAAKVRDFFVVHQGLDEPLNFPDFDYEKWIPPKTTSGQYNEHVAQILKEKLMKE